MFDTTSFSLPNRREVLKCTGMLAAAAPFIAGSASSSPQVITDIVDCHFHLWAKDKKRFPYQPDPPYAPEYASTADQWETERKGAGISMDEMSYSGT